MSRTTPRPVALFLILAGWLSSCSGPADELDTQISDALTSGNTIDATEASQIKAFITTEKKDLTDDKKTAKLVAADGSVDDTALLAYIKRNMTYRKLAKDGATPTVSLANTETRATPLQLKLYLEASGSMFPYDDQKADGKFKNTLNTLLTEFDGINSGQSKLFVVNTEVNPLGLTLPAFFREKNIFTVAKTKGKTTSTDFEGIFKTILTETTGNDLSVLVSDLIYSDPKLAGMSAQKTLDAASSLMTTVFNPYANTHSMLVLKMTAGFDGPYYSWNSPNKGKTYKGDRPYYLCLIGRKETMQQLLSDPAYAQIRRFEQLPGYEDSWLFEAGDGASAEPFYTVLVNDPARKGRFKKSEDETRSRAKATHSLTDVQPDVASKSLTIPVAVDLSKLNLPESLLTDANQYVVTGKDDFKITAVQPYNGANGTTHKLLLTSTRPARGNRPALIRLRRQFPPRWIAQTNTINDLTPDATTTFGLQNLLQGVERAYNPNNQPAYFTLTLNLE